MKVLNPSTFAYKNRFSFGRLKSATTHDGTSTSVKNWTHCVVLESEFDFEAAKDVWRHGVCYGSSKLRNYVVSDSSSTEPIGKGSGDDCCVERAVWGATELDWRCEVRVPGS